MGDKASPYDPKDNDVTHNKYAKYVTGSEGDFLVINKTGISAFYDGLVRAGGAIYQSGFEPLNSVAEVKTGPSYSFLLRKYLSKDNPNYLATPPSQEDKDNFNRLLEQIRREIKVADDCHL